MALKKIFIAFIVLSLFSFNAVSYLDLYSDNDLVNNQRTQVLDGDSYDTDYEILRDESPEMRCQAPEDYSGNMTLERNGLEVDDGENINDLEDNSELPSGLYDYRCNASESGDYNSDTINKSVLVVQYWKDTVNASVNDETYEYGDNYSVKVDRNSTVDYDAEALFDIESVIVDGKEIDVNDLPYSDSIDESSHIYVNSTETYRLNSTSVNISIEERSEEEKETKDNKSDLESIFYLILVIMIFAGITKSDQIIKELKRVIMP